jgi:hypothetical protein
MKFSICYLDLIQWARDRKSKENAGLNTLIPDSLDRVFEDFLTVNPINSKNITHLYFIYYLGEDFFIGKAAIIIPSVSVPNTSPEKKLTTQKQYIANLGIGIVPTIYIGDGTDQGFEFGFNLSTEFLLTQNLSYLNGPLYFSGFYSKSYITSQNLSRVPITFYGASLAVLWKLEFIFFTEMGFRLGLENVEISHFNSKSTFFVGAESVIQSSENQKIHTGLQVHFLNNNIDRIRNMGKDNFLTLYLGYHYYFWSK